MTLELSRRIYDDDDVGTKKEAAGDLLLSAAARPGLPVRR